jgi:hypothetical protein
MEFKQITDLAVLPPEIEFNFDELKNELETGLKKYKGMVVSEDGIKDAKADRAKLNSLYKAIDDKRKEIKRECMKPYDAFEKKAKVLLDMISGTAGAIDAQIKEFDNAKREEKRKEIEDYFCDNVGDLRDILQFNLIYNDRWVNATYKMDDIKKEIDESIKKTSDGLEAISGLKSEFELQIKDMFLKTLDLTAALAENTRLVERKKQMEEYKASEDRRKRIIEHIEEDRESEQSTVNEAPEEPKTIKVIFYDTTQAFRREMKALTEKHGVRYGGIQ